MKRILSILLITTLFAGELEVDGGLVVTESVTASSFVGDGSGLTNLQSLGGEKPDRIYTYKKNSLSNFTIPPNKAWAITFYGGSMDGVIGFIDDDGNGRDMHLYEYYSGQKIWFFQNEMISLDNNGAGGVFTIFEYSISGSGNDQGMDYIIP